jgi:hypothetical protein
MTRPTPPYSRIVTEQEHRWIPVTEKLPPDRARVAVIVLDHFDGAHQTCAACNDGKWPYPNVTHWMPLPPHPDGREFLL